MTRPFQHLEPTHGLLCCCMRRAAARVDCRSYQSLRVTNTFLSMYPPCADSRSGVNTNDRHFPLRPARSSPLLRHALACS
jgi:hypothetical protein